MTTESEIRVKRPQITEPSLDCSSARPGITEKIRIIVADNHPGFRQGLCRLLADEAGIQCVGQAADGREAIELASRLKPDVAMVDVAMPNMTGIEATRYILESSPQTAVLIVSAFGYQSYILSALRAGAVGYLTKDTPMQRLVAAIRVAYGLHGNGKPDGTVIRFLIAGGDNSKASESLTQDEIGLLKLAARGLRNDEIGPRLKISEGTVDSRVNAIFRKLNATSRTDALVEALKHGWVTAADLG